MCAKSCYGSTYPKHKKLKREQQGCSVLEGLEARLLEQTTLVMEDGRAGEHFKAPTDWFSTENTPPHSKG
jgi:hypothetical protein